MELGADQLLLHMTFVPSPMSEDNLAYLVMIVENINKHIVLMLVSKIDCTKMSKTNVLDVTCSYIGSETDPLAGCLFVMPLKNVPGIIVCAEDRFALVSDVRLPRFRTGSGIEFTERTRSPSKLLYSTWARTSHQKAQRFDESKDLVYLAREDGQIDSLAIESRPGQGEIPKITPLGCIGINIDKAFAIIDMKDDEYPVFIIGGLHSNGVIADSRPNASNQIRTVMANTDPVIDTTLVPGEYNGLHGWKRVFVTSGRGRRHGAVSEVRHGYANRALESHMTVDGTANSVIVSKAWILPYQNEDYLITATSNGVPSQLYRFNKDLSGHQQDLGPAQALSWSLVDRNSNHPWFSILEDGEETITIALTRHAYYLRVTRSNIQRLSFDLAKIEKLLSEDGTYRIILATIDSYNARVVFVFRGSPYVLACLNTSDSGPIAITYLNLVSEPSCIYIHNEDALAVAMLTTQKGKLKFYSLGPIMTHLSEKSIREGDEVCESLMVLRTANGGSSLMCGFRSGLLWYFDLVFGDHQNIILKKMGSISLGLTPVQIMPNYSHETHHTTSRSAFIFCEEKLYLFRENDTQLRESNLKQLWCTDSDGNGLRQPVILSLAVIPPWIQHTYLGPKDIFCITRDTIHLCRTQPDDGPRIIPWQIHVGGSPFRIIWSDHHKRLVVGLSVELEAGTTLPSTSKLGKLSPLLGIMMVDPNKDKAPITFNNKLSDYAAILDQSGDMISSLAEWDIVYNGKVYHMLLVSTVNGGSALGKVHLFDFKTADRKCRLITTYRAKNRGPVHAVAAYDSTSIIVLTHDFLIKLRLISESNPPRFSESILMKLQSPGINLRLHQDQIIIGTETLGLETYTIRGRSFERIHTDTIGSPSYHSTSIPTSHLPANIIVQLRSSPMAQNLYSYISVHYQGPEDPALLSYLRLPSRIIRLEQTSLRYPLQSNTLFSPYPRISAFAIDGAIYSLDMIPFRLWRLLRFIQNLIQSKTDDDPSPSVSVSVSVRPEEKIAEERYVDGDILHRVIEMGDQAAKDFIQGLLNDDAIAYMRSIWLSEFVKEEELVWKDDGLAAAAVLQLLKTIIDAP